MKISISNALGWRKSLQERHSELVSLRNQNSAREHRIYGQTDKEKTIEPLYDVIALDKAITVVAREMRKLDEAIKNTNMGTTVADYDRDDAVLGELVPAKVSG